MLFRYVVAVSGEITLSLWSQTAVVGSEATFLCGSTYKQYMPDWELKRWSTPNSSEWIVFEGMLNESYGSKYEARKAKPRQEPEHAARDDIAYQLIIHDITFDDAGEYTCIENEGAGESASANLTVVPHPDKIGTQYIRYRHVMPKHFRHYT